jgi:DNA-binding SARP family transcriptional activator/TolB-like protein
MVMDDLQTVYERARLHAGEGDWLRLSAHERTAAIYQEFRISDARYNSTRDQSPESKAKFVSSATTGQLIVRLRLTGQMEAWTVAGENILPTGRKTRALLASIALSWPRPAMRGRLAELLWSRRPEEQARASLRQEIQLLLKALAPAKAEILRVTRDHLSLVPGAIWIDVEETLRAAVSRSAALCLLDGELLEDLDGVDPAFDPWLTTERERLRDRARSMAETLLREQTLPDPIIAAAQRLLQIDRAHEEAWRALMRAHADQGERGMAIQAYDRCRTVLGDLLDALPSVETQRLLQEIRGPSSKRVPAWPAHQTTEPQRAEPQRAEPQRAGVQRAEVQRTAPRRWEVRDDDPIANDNRGRVERYPLGSSRIGVLPPRCVGLPDDVTYLGPSLANEITTALARSRWMSVVSSNSLARFARDSHNVAALRRSRGIDFLLDGAIQRSRNNLRVTLRLLDLREDNQVIWARRFDRQADDPLAVQEEISAEVAAQIEPVILMTEAKRGAARQNPNVTAFDLILRAAPLIARLERLGFMRAGEHLEQAIALEPDNASPHAWYAGWHILLIAQGWADDTPDPEARANELSERAIVLDPYSAGAFAVAGHARAVLNQNPQEAAALFERAQELNPNLAAAWALSAITQVLLGDQPEAERHYQRYKALSPLDPYSFMFDGLFAALHVLKRDYQSAATIGRAVTQLNPSYAAGYKPYLAALGHLGALYESGMILRRLIAIEPGVTVERCLRLFSLQRPADRDHFASGRRLAGMT